MESVGSTKQTCCCPWASPKNALAEGGCSCVATTYLSSCSVAKELSQSARCGFAPCFEAQLWAMVQVDGKRQLSSSASQDTLSQHGDGAHVLQCSEGPLRVPGGNCNRKQYSKPGQHGVPLFTDCFHQQHARSQKRHNSREALLVLVPLHEGAPKDKAAVWDRLGDVGQKLRRQALPGLG